MSWAIRMHRTGGPEVLQWEEIEIPPPATGEVRLRQTAVGVNFSEARTRQGGGGTDIQTDFPLILGREAAGIVEELGEGVTDFRVGQHVAYGLRWRHGAYAEERIIPAAELVPLPGQIDDRMAAAVMVKGMTACYLLRRTFDVRPSHKVLVHIASGGVGSILCQWAKHLGAIVIGSGGSTEKLALAQDNGCDLVVNYTNPDFAAKIRDYTDGYGVDVVFDAAGKLAFEGSLDSLATHGMFVAYGGVIPTDVIHDTLAHFRRVMEASRSGMVRRSFQAMQQASTMAS